MSARSGAIRAAVSVAGKLPKPFPGCPALLRVRQASTTQPVRPPFPIWLCGPSAAASGTGGPATSAGAGDGATVSPQTAGSARMRTDRPAPLSRSGGPRSTVAWSAAWTGGTGAGGISAGGGRRSFSTSSDGGGGGGGSASPWGSMMGDDAPGRGDNPIRAPTTISRSRSRQKTAAATPPGSPWGGMMGEGEAPSAAAPPPSTADDTCPAQAPTPAPAPAAGGWQTLVAKHGASTEHLSAAYGSYAIILGPSRMHSQAIYPPRTCRVAYSTACPCFLGMSIGLAILIW